MQKLSVREVNAELEQPDVWNDPEKAQALGKNAFHLNKWLISIKNLEQGLEDVEGLLELALKLRMKRPSMKLLPN